MILERAAMRGKLAEKKQAAASLKLRIEGHCRLIREGLNTALTPVADLEVPLMAGQMDALVMAWGEMTAISLDIARLEKELA